jgi:hypothetical protein
LGVPERNQYTRYPLLDSRVTQFLQIDFLEDAPVTSLLDNIKVDAAAFAQMAKMVDQQLRNSFGKD